MSKYFVNKNTHFVSLDLVKAKLILGVPQGSILCLIPFTCYLNELDQLSDRKLGNLSVIKNFLM